MNWFKILVYDGNGRIESQMNYETLEEALDIVNSQWRVEFANKQVYIVKNIPLCISIDEGAGKVFPR